MLVSPIPGRYLPVIMSGRIHFSREHGYTVPLSSVNHALRLFQSSVSTLLRHDFVHWNRIAAMNQSSSRKNVGHPVDKLVISHRRAVTHKIESDPRLVRHLVTYPVRLDHPFSHQNLIVVQDIIELVGIVCERPCAKFS